MCPQRRPMRRVLVMYKSVADLGDLEMAKQTTLTRDSIVRALTKGLQPLPSVHAFWESGAAAFNRIDQWSDIDLYIVVDDAAAAAETFLVVEKALAALSPIRLKHEVSWPPTSGIYQKFYRLAGTSEFLLVDLAVMTLSAPDKFLVREIHGEAVFLFNKGDTVRVPPLDAEAFVRGLLERRRRLAERMELFGPFVPKEIHRRNWLEALEFYAASSSRPSSKSSACNTARSTMTSACATSIASCRRKSCDDLSISRSSRIRMTSRRSTRRPLRGSPRPSTRSTRGRFADRSSNRELRRL